MTIYKFMGYCARCGKPVFDYYSKTTNRKINCSCYSGPALGMTNTKDYRKQFSVQVRMWNWPLKYGSQ
jgi:hypothetical protein